jgi:hypothetical protein
MNPPREQWLARLDVCWGRLISTKDNGPLRLALRAREGVVDAAVIVVPVAVVIVVPVAVAPLPVLSLSVVVQWRHCLVIRHPSSVIRQLSSQLRWQPAPAIHPASSGSRGWRQVCSSQHLL